LTDVPLKLYLVLGRFAPAWRRIHALRSHTLLELATR
jgi:hypothetical protein